MALDFVDSMVVRLADDQRRAALFDQAGLEQIVRAAYDADAMTLAAPYRAVFEQVFVGLSLPIRTRADAAWGSTTGGDRHEGRVTLFGVGTAGTVRVDALWRGAIVATAGSPLAHVDRVTASWSGVEDRLEGLTTVGFSDAPTETAPRTLPIAAAILVRAEVRVAELLAQSKLLADQLEDLGVERARDEGAARAQAVVIVWMIPASTFDDPAWPGGEAATTDEARRELRRQTAGRWLAREGIGLVTTATT